MVDFLRAGEADFKKCSKQSEMRFDMKEKNSLTCDVSRFRLKLNKSLIIVQTKTHYTNTLNERKLMQRLRCLDP